MFHHLQISPLDLRLSIMAAVLLALGLFFHLLTGQFLTPENLYNIAQQTAVVGIIAAAMALVIVARQIDLSVGSALGLVGVLIAWLMYTKGWHWVPASLAGLAVSLVVGLYQGWLTAGLGVPSFVVTLGGLMSLRGAAFLVADGKTQPVTDAFFLQLGGGLDGAIGPVPSLALAAAGVAWLVHRAWQRRRLQRRHGLAPRPLWFDVMLTAFFSAAALGFALAMSAYRIGERTDGQGLPVPVLIWAAVVAGVSFLVNRTRFGRYVYAIGGNPEAALLVGIPVRKVMLQLFLLLAVLVTVAAVVAVARLNAGTNSLGLNQELYVIAAAVIGGVALSGGSGTVIGTVLGALVIQFLESGLLLLDVAIGWRMVIVGQVLIVAVVFDVLFRRATGERL
ncbi:D-xylose transport system permease protein [Sphaerotilus sulfidivorans]|uniref:ABC transporter permease n=1 Tax=Sphaerotilus sulfidivorans TaxID=639200 RepID=A0A5C1Q6D8_9BURK|nr:ABC transporter permease [Sphaerotilus sulfidivorans]NZD45117.1 ABC transporter permease [Sphaerotilus sulfidivorans]QEN02386.1 ABC transporter permease [Sphaerotilus sulfidivorans]